MNEILEQDVSLTLGLINESNNQYECAKKENNKKNEEIIIGDANMLARMI